MVITMMNADMTDKKSVIIDSHPIVYVEPVLGKTVSSDSLKSVEPVLRKTVSNDSLKSVEPVSSDSLKSVEHDSHLQTVLNKRVDTTSHSDIVDVTKGLEKVKEVLDTCIQTKDCLNDDHYAQLIEKHKIGRDNKDSEIVTFIKKIKELEKKYEIEDFFNVAYDVAEKIIKYSSNNDHLNSMSNPIPSPISNPIPIPIPNLLNITLPIGTRISPTSRTSNGYFVELITPITISVKSGSPISLDGIIFHLIDPNDHTFDKPLDQKATVNPIESFPRRLEINIPAETMYCISDNKLDPIGLPQKLITNANFTIQPGSDVELSANSTLMTPNNRTRIVIPDKVTVKVLADRTN
jgi:hypothetical protein